MPPCQRIALVLVINFTSMRVKKFIACTINRCLGSRALCAKFFNSKRAFRGREEAASSDECPLSRKHF